MKLIDIKENAITVELDWGDVALLSYVCREAMAHDAIGDAHDFSMTWGYVETLVSFFEAAGMASWADTVSKDEYTIERFRLVVPVTAKQRRLADALDAAEEKGGEAA